jgi:hypothetical protein
MATVPGTRADATADFAISSHLGRDPRALLARVNVCPEVYALASVLGGAFAGLLFSIRN